MSKTRLIVAMVAIASLGSIAAADGYEPAGKGMLAPVADYAWGGLYVGVGVGGAQFDNSVDVEASKSKKRERYKKCDSESGGCWEEIGYREHNTSGHFGDDEWNVFGTMQVGYDHLMGKKFLVGVFADFDFYPDSDNSFSMPWVEYLDDDKKKKIGSIKGNLDLENIWSVGGRLGFLATPKTLIYGAGGYSEASLGGSVDVKFRKKRRRKSGNQISSLDKKPHGRNNGLSLDVPDELNGWFLEGGIEHKIHRNVSLKLAYRYTDLESGSASDWNKKGPYYGDGCDSKCRITKESHAHANFDAEIHSVRATLVISLTPEQRPVVPLK